jgi:lycopene beta-cyclase
MTNGFDYMLVGGGLQCGLIALALRAHRPESRIGLVERETRLGGNHTWCFHATDVSPAALEWIRPLVCRHWPAYTVRFPGLQRRIEGTYSAITSDRFDRVVRAAFDAHEGSSVFLGAGVTRIEGSNVHLEDGRRLQGRVVIDARGPSRSDSGPPTAGFQKFVGLEVRSSTPHGLPIPTLMDATVDQANGFRFFYTLPLAADRLLIEDTYFHQSPDLDVDAIRAEITTYAQRQGYEIASVEREEAGVLPMPWRGSLPSRSDGPIAAGYGGGWFHPATGYSFPVAARLAHFLAERSVDRVARHGVDELVRPHVRQARYCHLLNRFLFRWYPPEARWHIFARFYRMPLETIERFYALRMTVSDRFRLLVGRPPRGLSLAFRFGAGGSS